MTVVSSSRVRSPKVKNRHLDKCLDADVVSSTVATRNITNLSFKNILSHTANMSIARPPFLHMMKSKHQKKSKLTPEAVFLCVCSVLQRTVNGL